MVLTMTMVIMFEHPLQFGVGALCLYRGYMDEWSRGRGMWE